jgi:hypothetical protein
MTYKSFRIQLQIQCLGKKMHLLGMHDVQLDSCRTGLWEITGRRIQSLSDMEGMLTITTGVGSTFLGGRVHVTATRRLFSVIMLRKVYFTS